MVIIPYMGFSLVTLTGIFNRTEHTRLNKHTLKNKSSDSEVFETKDQFVSNES